jgi:hypothetical protein
MAEFYTDGIQDILEQLDLGATLIEEAVLGVFESIPLVGSIVESIVDVAQNARDYAIANFTDTDAVALVRCCLYCAFTNANDIDNMSFEDWFQYVPQALGLDLPIGFDDALELAFDSYEAEILGVAALIVIYADYNLRHKRFMNQFAVLANQAAFFDARDCSACDCEVLPPVNSTLHWTVGTLWTNNAGGTLSRFELDANALTVYVDFTNYAGNYRETGLGCSMTSTGTFTSFKVRVTARNNRAFVRNWYNIDQYDWRQDPVRWGVASGSGEQWVCQGVVASGADWVELLYTRSVYKLPISMSINTNRTYPSNNITERLWQVAWTIVEVGGVRTNGEFYV